jgi:hypothetical protein
MTQAKILAMENFRDFQIGPDPFGQTWHVLFKYLQTGISIRHSDSVDIRFVLDNGTERMQKTLVLAHADIRAYAQRTGRKISDAWCSRIARLKLQQVIENAEDMEKDYLLVTPKEIEEYDTAIRKWEDQWVKEHAA